MATFEIEVNEREAVEVCDGRCWCRSVEEESSVGNGGSSDCYLTNRSTWGRAELHVNTLGPGT